MSTLNGDGSSEQLDTDLRAGPCSEEAFRRLFTRHYRPLLAFFIKRGRFALPECEELAQETFLRVHRGMATFRRDVSFDQWIFFIAANVHRSAVEKRTAAKRDGQEVPLESQAGPATWGPASMDQDPLDQVLNRERMQMLRQAMEELPEQMRRCLNLRIEADLRYREIAEIMQISVQTVKAHLAQAREKLRRILSAQSEEALPRNKKDHDRRKTENEKVVAFSGE